MATSLYQPDSVIHPYTADVLRHMKLQESRFCKRYFRRSPQLECRRYLVDWLCVVAEKTRLRRGTVHLAVKLLDFFMDAHNIEVNRIYVVAIACLSVAAKFEEKDSRVPKLESLTACIPMEIPHAKYNHDEHVQLEAMVLKYFDWNVFIPTANSYVEVLLPHAISATDSMDDGDPICSYIERAKDGFMDFVMYFLDISLQDPNVTQYLPSVLSASVLFASREAYGLKPNWTIGLEEVTGFSRVQFEDCSGILLSTFERASGIDNRLLSNAMPTPKGESKKKKRTSSTTTQQQQQQQQSKRRKRGKNCAVEENTPVFKIERKPRIKRAKPLTPDEGYVSFSAGPQQEVKRSSLEILLKASDTIEAAETKHENLKEEILRSAAQPSSPNRRLLDVNGTNIEGHDVRHGNMFLYTVVKDEKS